ncbi:uncharacterized protein At4g38062-like [Andrographis paniculata]|uniref:uncharacterized protein At4g38062-like n=1 Tax=Andrographis paniculata TaxID=175694 RepID=UPI0021E7C2CF|nr:uncharacterized protein At4g38062-like [Andrographis paniculata]
MEKIYDELNEVKIEVEKLREECLAKTKLAESLGEANVKELEAKSVEISEIRHMCEGFQSSLHRKDLLLLGCNGKISKLEGENRDLALALDKASARIQDLENKTSASSEELAGLRMLLSVKAGKIVEVQDNVSKDMKERNEYILKLEEEIRTTRDQLKWRNEQFFHLEEAHNKLQSQFMESKMEWQEEQSLFINEVSSLRANLDAQNQAVKSLESQLTMTQDALAHEQSRRKDLDHQLSECRSQFENVSQECHTVKSEVEELTMRRDEQIAELRKQLRIKEKLANEMKHKTVQLEKENSDRLDLLKAIQEAERSKTSGPSLKKLQKRLDGLEKLHSNFSVQLQEKEADRNSQIEKLTGDVECYLSELCGKSESIKKIHKELEDCQWLLEAKNDEASALIMMLKSEFDAAYSKLYDAKGNLEMDIMRVEEENAILNQQLQLKNTELHHVHAELKQRCEEMADLLKHAESCDLDSLNQKNFIMEEELREHKVMLKESNERHRLLEQKFLEVHSERERIQDALEVADLALVNKSLEVKKSMLEFQKCESEVESLRMNLVEIQELHDQEKANLLETMNDKDVVIAKSQKHISDLESAILDKSRTNEVLENDNAHLKKALAEREEGKIALELEIKNLATLVAMKDKKIQELQIELESLDQNLKHATMRQSEMEELKSQLEKTRSCLEEHESHKEAMLEGLMNASIDKEQFMAQLEIILGQINVLTKQDDELGDLLEKILHLSGGNHEPERNRLSSGGNDTTLLSSRKSIQVSFDERTPLTELNC